MIHNFFVSGPQKVLTVRCSDICVQSTAFSPTEVTKDNAALFFILQAKLFACIWALDDMSACAEC